MLNQPEFIQAPAGTAPARAVGVGVGVFWRELMTPLTVGRSGVDPLPPLVPHVLDVGLLSVGSKVSRVSAGATINTRVADIQPLRDLGFISEHPCKDMGPFASTIKCGSTVSLLIDMPRPRVACVWSATAVKPEQYPFALAHARRTRSIARNGVTPPVPVLVMTTTPTATMGRSVTALNGTGTLCHGIDSSKVGSSGRRSHGRGRRLRTFYRVGG